MAIYISRVSSNNNGRDGINITSSPSSQNTSDGIAITTNPSTDIYVRDTVTDGNKRYGLNIDVTHETLESHIKKLTLSGVNPSTPPEEIAHAYNELSTRNCVTELDKEKTLKEIGFTKYVSRGANLATIASLIIQIFELTK